MKIFLNYLQMIAIIQGLELKWPFYVRNYLNIYSNIGGVSTQFLSFECLLQDYSIKNEPIYIKTIAVLTIPLITIIISLLFLIAIYLKKGKKQTIRFIVIFIVVSIFVQPSIIRVLFNNITCKDLEGEKYLNSNLLINCNSKSHLNWVRRHNLLK